LDYQPKSYMIPSTPAPLDRTDHMQHVSTSSQQDPNVSQGWTSRHTTLSG